LMAQILALPMATASSRAPLPAAFDGWFARSCDRDPSRRFRSVGEQIEALAVALSQTLSRPRLQGTSPPVTPRMAQPQPQPHPFRSTTPLPQLGPPAEAPSPPAVVGMPPAPIVNTNAAMGMAHTKLGASAAMPLASPWPKLVAGGVVVLATLLVVGLFARQVLHRDATPSGNVAMAGLTAPPPAVVADVVSSTTANEPTVIVAPPPRVETPPAATPTAATPSPLPRTKAREATAEADAGARADVKPGIAADPPPVSRPVRPAIPAATYAPTAL